MSQSLKTNVNSATLCFGITLSMLMTIFSLLIGSVAYEQFIFDRLHLTENAERNIVRLDIRLYLNHEVSLPSALFTEREIVHMGDVRFLVQREQHIAHGLLMLLLIIFFMSNFPSSQWRILLHRTMFWLIVCIGVFGAAGVFFFDRLFTGFHQLLFTNDFWLLDPAESALIRAYPPEFFEAFAQYSFWILLACCMLLYIASSGRWHRGKTMVF